MSCYYKISPSVDLEVIGSSAPLDMKWREQLDPWAPNCLYGLPHSGLLPADARFPDYILSEEGKLTDYTFDSSLGRYLFISKRFLEVIRQFKLDEHQIFDSPIQANGMMHPYFILYLVHERREFVLWEKSVFYKRPKAIDWKQAAIDKKMPEDNEFEPVSGLTFDEFVKLDNSRLIGRKEVLLDRIVLEYDLLRITWPAHQIIVSQRLKDAIQQAGLTGMDFKPADWIAGFADKAG